MSAQNPLNSKAVKGIMQKRILIAESHVGKRIFLTVQGNGTVIDVTNAKGELVQSVREPGTVLQKKIVNFRANSAVAMANPDNRKLLFDAITAEKAGDTQKADELFSSYLNKVQISYGLLLPATISDQLTSGCDISAKIQKITVKNADGSVKGHIFTLEDGSINIMAPEVAGMTSFSFPDEEEDDETTVPAEDQFAAMDRAALVKFNKDNALGLKTKNMTDDEIRAGVRAAYRPVTASDVLNDDEEF